MKFQIKINSINSVDQIEEYWTENDYVQLLKNFDYPDGENAQKENLRELLLMAITDFEPQEAAAIVLEYKLADHLNEGQIQQISNDMLLDKISEEYPDIALQSTLFHINQLLFKAYNGKFPNAKATIFECSITPLENNSDTVITKEMALKLLSKGLSESSLIKRLFDEQMNQNVAFPEAENILWELITKDNTDFRIITSEYWLSEEDFILQEFEAVSDEAENEV